MTKRMSPLVSYIPNATGQIGEVKTKRKPKFHPKAIGLSSGSVHESRALAWFDWAEIVKDVPVVAVKKAAQFVAECFLKDRERPTHVERRKKSIVLIWDDEKRVEFSE